MILLDKGTGIVIMIASDLCRLGLLCYKGNLTRGSV